MSKKSYPIFIVDAFSSEAFGGNPAAVCLLTRDVTDAEKQRVAAEMNLSETAFVVPEGGEDLSGQSPESVFGDGGRKRFGLRWFTPASEVPLCGHATVAAAAVIFTRMWNQNKTLEFVTKYSGVLTCTNESGGGDKSSSPSSSSSLQIAMSIPVHEAEPLRADWRESDPEARALVEKTLSGSSLGLGDVAEALLTPGMHRTLVVRLADGCVDRAGFEAIPVPAAKLDEDDGPAEEGRTRRIGTLMITVKGEEGGEYDFLSRFFAPWLGVPEDPVTGSSFSTLAPYWSKALGGRREMTARQCSRRGGVVRMRLEGGQEDRVVLTGGAAVVVSGTISY